MLSSGENMLPYLTRPPFLADQRWKPDVELAPNCPRCDSSNTKFCYYNNYSLSQPRYFCKGCRRYWTKGGSLRNVPVGGGCRKNRRARSARLSTSRARAPSRDSNNVQECLQLPRASVRPDLALDDPLGGSCRSSGSSTVSSMEASASDGSNVDLALLYSRFLNQCSANFDPAGLAEPEAPEDIDESSELSGVAMNSDHQPTLQPVLQGHRAPDLLQRLPADMFPETQLSNDFLPWAVDQGIWLDPNSRVPQMLPGEGFAYDDVFWTASSTGAAGSPWQYRPPKSTPGMATVREDHHLQLHSNLFSSTWDSFGLTNYDAFPRST